MVHHSSPGNEQLFYLMSRGLSEAEASAMIVTGFIEPLVKLLLLLLDLSLKGLDQLVELSL